MQSRLLITLLVATGFVTACSDPGTTGPTPPEAATLEADVAAAASMGIIEGVDVMSGMTGLPRAQVIAAAFHFPPGDPGNVTGCTYGGESWTCPHTRVNGLDVVRTITFRDAADAVQQHFDGATTAAIDIAMTVNGQLTNEPWTATISRTRTLTWSGLVGAETTRNINGQGSETVSRARFTSAGTTRTYDIAGNFLIANVVMPVPTGNGDHWPLSGTVTRTYTVTGPSGSSVTRTVVVTFNGTAQVPVTVGDAAFILDLTTRTLTPATG